MKNNLSLLFRKSANNLLSFSGKLAQTHISNKKNLKIWNFLSRWHQINQKNKGNFSIIDRVWEIEQTEIGNFGDWPLHVVVSKMVLYPLTPMTNKRKKAKTPVAKSSKAKTTGERFYSCIWLNLHLWWTMPNLCLLPMSPSDMPALAARLARSNVNI